MACSTSFSYEGRVGWHRRLGNVSLLSFGVDPGGEFRVGAGVDKAKAAADADSLSMALSGMLPFVVAATAVAALTHPPTFSWLVTLFYSPISVYFAAAAAVAVVVRLLKMQGKFCLMC